LMRVVQMNSNPRWQILNI